MRLVIDVVFDLICPWCLIGKRQLDTALAELAQVHPEARVHVRWQGVQLIPDVPATGLPFAEFYRQRLGGAAAVRARQRQVLDVAHVAGAEIHFDRIDVFPNTARAHTLLDFAAAFAPAQHETLLERLFQAYFVDGIDLGDAEQLLRCAQQCGIDTTEIAPTLHALLLPQRAQGLAVSGVPSFMFDRRFALSGAQPPAALLSAMQQALIASAAEAAP